MNHLTIHEDKGTGRISRHLYGHFAEHLGTGVYGGLWVGPDSPIPNTRGIRNDVLAALRELRVANIRWPGGCFAEAYHWRNGVGPQNERVPIANCYCSSATESHAFGTHEFLDLCELLGAEPYICGNMGTGSPQEMADWIEYITTAHADSPLGQLRRRNGREQPWPLKYWAVGNENWGCGGHMTALQYAWEYRRFQTFCRHHGDGSLYKIACGWRDEWNEQLLADALPYIDGLSIHHYSRAGTWGRGNDLTDFTLRGDAVDFTPDDWWEIMGLAHHMDAFVARTAAIMDRYDPGKRVGLIVDEWGTWYHVEKGRATGSLYQQNTVRDAVVAGLTLNILHAHADRVHMANLAQMVNVLQAVVLTDGERMLRTPTYHVLNLYKVHQDATLLPTELACGHRAVGDWQVPLLSASASRDDSGNIHVSLCNVHDTEAASVSCELSGASPLADAAISGQVLTGPAMNSRNLFDDPDAIIPTAFTGFRLDGARLVLDLPAHSVTVLRITPRGALVAV